MCYNDFKGGCMLCAIFIAASLCSMVSSGADLHTLKKDFEVSYQDWKEHLNNQQRWLDDKMADWDEQRPKDRTFWWQGLLRTSFGRKPIPPALRATPKDSDVSKKLSSYREG